MYLFDTDVITNVLKPRPSTHLIERLKGISDNEQYISTITLSEIVYGAIKSGRPKYHLKNLEEILLPSLNLVDFDAKAAYICGKLRTELEQKGKPLSLADLEIAAIAIAGDFILVTGNDKHFNRIDELMVENWLLQ
jgi:predicted nucleic acid-binding protein